MTSDYTGWDEHLRRQPEATFYHTRLWASILGEAFPALQDESRWIETENGRAAVPLFTWRRFGGLVRTVHSSFPFLYGGPVPRLLGGRDLLPDLLAELGASSASAVIVANPFARANCSPPPTVRLSEEATHLLRLPGTVEEFWDRILTTSKRNDVRRLTKKGVTVRRGGTEEEIGSVYRFYRESFARWGQRPRFVYPEALYHAMVRLGGDHVRFYVAEYEGKIIGGAFIPRWGDHAHYHAGYFDHTSRALRPNVLIQEQIIREAIEDGFTNYDFLPSGGNQGVETFKESFGGVRTSITRYEHRSLAHRLLAALRHSP